MLICNTSEFDAVVSTTPVCSTPLFQTQYETANNQLGGAVNGEETKIEKPKSLSRGGKQTWSLSCSLCLHTLATAGFGA